jgi:hypothetical protein
LQTGMDDLASYLCSIFRACLELRHTVQSICHVFY